MIYNITVTLICIIIPIIVFRKSERIKDKGLKIWLTENKYEIGIYIILVIGFLTRMVNIQNVPNGLNVDEASSGYEAYSIANFGIDRNGKLLPVFLISWGSGQNALYTYMIVPFVKIFGLSVLTTRLPMAILGCVSLLIMYKLLLIIRDKKLALIGLAFFAICPWHIMKSRWGLESNIFPDMVFISIYLIIRALKDNKNYLLYTAFVILGLCSYAYGTSYFFLPLFVIPLLIYLIIKKKINIKQAIVCFGIVFVIALPIILCVIINKFDLPEMKFIIFTIPRMTLNRYEDLSSLFSGNIIVNSWNNFVKSCKILLFQSDGSLWNSIFPYGTIYIFSLPFTIIGIINNFKKEKNQENKVYKQIINIWFIVSVLLLFVCTPNINRINIIFVPIIYYTIIGLFEIIEKMPKVLIILIFIYIISFVLFMYTYINTNFDKCLVFTDNIKDTVQYINNINEDTIYMQYTFKEPYIYVLFYNNINPNIYHNTVEYFRNSGFDNVKSFGKYKFYLPNEIVHKNGVAYVITKDNNLNIDYSDWETTYFDKFIVLENIMGE